MHVALTASRLRELLDYDPATGGFRWRVSISQRVKAGDQAGADDGKGYTRIGIDYRVYQAHRLAWLYVHGEWPRGQIDHRDLEPSHNWISNLREATRRENKGNSRRAKNNTSGFKGAYWEAHIGRWRARIRKDGRLLHLGLFDSAEEAHAAYCAAAKDVFGQFARAA